MQAGKSKIHSSSCPFPKVNRQSKTKERESLRVQNQHHRLVKLNLAQSLLSKLHSAVAHGGS